MSIQKIFKGASVAYRIGKRAYPAVAAMAARKRMLRGYGRRLAIRGRRSTGKRAFRAQRAGYGYGNSMGYSKRRRTSKRAYKRKLLTSTAGDNHFRSVDTVGVVMDPTTSSSAKTWYAERMLPSDFWVPPKLKLFGEQVPNFQDKLTIRGGLVRQTFFNESTVSSLRVEVYKIWVKDLSAIINLIPPYGIISRDTNAGDDPTTFYDNADTSFRKYSIVKRYNFLLQPSGTYTIAERISPRVLRQENDRAGDGVHYYWITWMLRPNLPSKSH